MTNLDELEKKLRGAKVNFEFHRGCPVVYGSGNLLFDTRTSFFTDETLKTFLFGASIGPQGLSDCHLLPAKTGVDGPPRALSRRDPLWKAIYEDLQEHGGAFGTQLTGREDAIEVRPNTEPNGGCD